MFQARDTSQSTGAVLAENGGWVHDNEAVAMILAFFFSYSVLTTGVAAPVPLLADDNILQDTDMHSQDILVALNGMEVNDIHKQTHTQTK